jgi:hypothetical protein
MKKLERYGYYDLNQCLKIRLLRDFPLGSAVSACQVIYLVQKKLLLMTSLADIKMGVRGL